MFCCIPRYTLGSEKWNALINHEWIAQFNERHRKMDAARRDAECVRDPVVPNVTETGLALPLSMETRLRLNW